MTSPTEKNTWNKFTEGKSKNDIKILKECVTKFKKEGDQVGIKKALKTIGTIYYKKNKIEKAIEYYKKASTTQYFQKEESHIVLEKSMLYYTLSLLFSKIGKEKEAQDFLAKIKDKEFVENILVKRKKEEEKKRIEKEKESEKSKTQKPTSLGKMKSQFLKKEKSVKQPITNELSVLDLENELDDSKLFEEDEKETKHRKTPSFYERNKNFTINDNGLFDNNEVVMELRRSAEAEMEEENNRKTIKKQKIDFERKRILIEKKERIFQENNYLKLLEKMDEIIEEEKKKGIEYKDHRSINMKCRLTTNLGSIYFRKKDYIKAKVCYKKTLKMKKQIASKDLLIPYNNIGKLYCSTFNYSKALKYFIKSHRCDKKNTVVLNNILNVYVELKEYRKSIQCLKKIARIEKNEQKLFVVYKKFGFCFYKLKEYLKAQKFYKAARRINRNDPDVNINLENLQKLNKL